MTVPVAQDIRTGWVVDVCHTGSFNGLEAYVHCHAAYLGTEAPTTSEVEFTPGDELWIPAEQLAYLN